MSEIKTRPTQVDVRTFLQNIEHERRRQDAYTLVDVFTEVTGWSPVMWGESIIGFGQYTYTLANGKTNQFMRTGFSPRKQNLSLYIMTGFNAHRDMVNELGKVKTAKSCLYINKLADVDMEVLKKLIKADVEIMARKYPL